MFDQVSELARGFLTKGEIQPGMDSECWEFTGRGYRGAYPSINLKGQNPVYAHRYIFSSIKGEIPPGKQVNHCCNNKRCIRPDHLYCGTQAENMQDMIRSGRSARGSRHHRAKITGEQALEIAQRVRDGERSVEIARTMGLEVYIIKNVKFGKSWSWLTGLAKYQR